MIIKTTNSTITKKQITSAAKQLESYRQHMVKIHQKKIFTEPESSINLSFSNEADNALSMVKKVSSKELQTIILVGIGGSNLGTKAIYDALPKRKGIKKMYFLETVSGTQFISVTDELIKHHSHKNQFLIIVVSKSGETIETITNCEALLFALKKSYGDVTDRLVMITDEDSRLWKLSGEQKINHLAIPKMVGGRFSVFSAVGLFPLALCGFDVRALRAGAREMIKTGLASDTEKNTALSLALITHLLRQKGFVIHNSFFFAPELESLGKWERQLIGESLGKEFNMSGKRVRTGITPMVSIGSTDLHSMAQLFFGGPRNIFTTIIETKHSLKIQIPKQQKFSALTNHLSGKTFTEVMRAITQGVLTTYQKNKLPFVLCTFDKINEKTIGMFLQMRMLEIMYLAHLMQINAFDQPDVEGYKKETQNRLRV